MSNLIMPTIMDIRFKISLIIALFMKVEWKPIEHTDSSSIEEIENIK